MTLVLAVLDSVLEVQAPLAVVAELTALWPAAVHSGPGVSRSTTARVSLDETPSGYEVRGPNAVEAAQDLSEGLEVLLALLNRLAVEQCRDFAAHAGVVAVGTQGVAIPAESGVGKSTLVAACVQQGWVYVSDEALVVGDDLGVRAYTKPVSLHAWSLERLGLAPALPGRLERAVSVAELGAAATGPVTVSHLVLPKRVPGPPVLTAVSRAAAATVLLAHSFNHYRDPVSSLRRVSGLSRGCSAWQLEYDDPVQAAELLSERWL